jgi:hypothetical protein
MRINRQIFLGLVAFAAIGTAYAGPVFLTNTSVGAPLLAPGTAGIFGNSVSDGEVISTDNKWYFTIATPYELDASDYDAAPGSITGLALNLYTIGNALVGGDDDYSDTGIHIPQLFSGTYYLLVTGTGTAHSVSYGGSAGVSAVPLPAAAWLLLSGVAGLGVMGRRRKMAAAA